MASNYVKRTGGYASSGWSRAPGPPNVNTPVNTESVAPESKHEGARDSSEERGFFALPLRSFPDSMLRRPDTKGTMDSTEPAASEPKKIRPITKACTAAGDLMARLRLLLPLPKMLHNTDMIDTTDNTEPAARARGSESKPESETKRLLTEEDDIDDARACEDDDVYYGAYGSTSYAPDMVDAERLAQPSADDYALSHDGIFKHLEYDMCLAYSRLFGIGPNGQITGVKGLDGGKCSQETLPGSLPTVRKIEDTFAAPAGVQNTSMLTLSQSGVDFSSYFPLKIILAFILGVFLENICSNILRSGLGSTIKAKVMNTVKPMMKRTLRQLQRPLAMWAVPDEQYGGLLLKQDQEAHESKSKSYHADLYSGLTNAISNIAGQLSRVKDKINSLKNRRVWQRYRIPLALVMWDIYMMLIRVLYRIYDVLVTWTFYAHIARVSFFTLIFVLTDLCYLDEEPDRAADSSFWRVNALLFVISILVDVLSMLKLWTSPNKIFLLEVAVTFVLCWGSVEVFKWIYAKELPPYGEGKPKELGDGLITAETMSMTGDGEDVVETEDRHDAGDEEAKDVAATDATANAADGHDAGDEGFKVVAATDAAVIDAAATDVAAAAEILITDAATTVPAVQAVVLDTSEEDWEMVW